MRIGRSKWIRTLLNGMGRCSLNSKFVASNDMNGCLSLWDWRESEVIQKIENIKNTNNYQYIYFGHKQGCIESLLFLEEDGHLMKHDLLSNRTFRSKLFPMDKNDNWKLVIR